MADSKVLRIEDDGAVRLLTLDRPESKNAFNNALYDGVRSALDAAAADDAITVCVITGAGDVFSAGQDLKALAGTKDNPEGAWAFDPFARALAAFDKPLIAAVNGAAVGIGTTMLLHCDLVLASETARFKLPFVALDLAPEAASSLLLPAAIGPQAAAYYLLTGDWIDAETAVDPRPGLEALSPGAPPRGSARPGPEHRQSPARRTAQHQAPVASRPGRRRDGGHGPGTWCPRRDHPPLPRSLEVAHAEARRQSAPFKP